MSRRAFHFGDLVSVVSGKLVSPEGISGIYAVVDFVTGAPHHTHQLPRASREITPWLIEQHPWLAEVKVPHWVHDNESLFRWLPTAVEQYGELHELEPMPEGRYVPRDPIVELAETRERARQRLAENREDTE